jgi:Predicted periplasmic protein
LNGILAEQTVSLNLKRKEIKTKKLVVAALAVLILASASMILIANSGSVDFDIERNESEIRITNTSKGPLEGFTWTVRDEMNFMRSSTAVSDSGIILDPDGELFGPGVYRVTLTAQGFLGEKNQSKLIVINGDRVNSVVWVHNAKPYYLEYSITTSSMIQYLKGGAKGGIERWPGNSANSDLVGMYAGTTDGALTKLITDLRDIADKAKLTNETELTNFIMAFVQYGITYEEDSETAGSPEYWRYPMETLYSGVGDCEDVAMLTMALLKGVFKLNGMDKNVALALFWGNSDVGGHAMAAIELGSAPTAMPVSTEIMVENTNLYNVDGKTYYVCETTNTGWKAGWISVKYNMAPDHLIVI